MSTSDLFVRLCLVECVELGLNSLALQADSLRSDGERLALNNQSFTLRVFARFTVSAALLCQTCQIPGLRERQLIDQPVASSGSGSGSLIVDATAPSKVFIAASC